MEWMNNPKLNNRLANIIHLFSVLILVYCLGIYIVNNCFPVNKIIIEGKLEHVTPLQLSYVAHNKLHGTFFTLDIQGLKNEFEKLPWVNHVEVQRYFPHTVMVSLQEYHAVARIGDENFLADNGKIFDGADDSNSLPILYLENSYQAPQAFNLTKQLDLILQRHQDRLDKLWLTIPSITKISTQKGLTITLCGKNVISNMERLDVYWSRLYHLNPNIKNINLCYKDGLAFGT
jgi:cell division protein FtsQ